MIKINSILIILLVASSLFSCQIPKQVNQNSNPVTYSSQIKLFQEEMNKSYKNVKESPLQENECKKFKSLPFFAFYRY